MYYTREQHKRFLDRELQAVSENYIRVLNTKAIALLSENEIYVAQFMKVDFEKTNISEVPGLTVVNIKVPVRSFLNSRKTKEFLEQTSILLRCYLMETSVFRGTGETFHGQNCVNSK